MKARPYRQKLQQTLQRLNPRERGFLVAGAAGLALFAFLQWVIVPLFDHRDRLQRRLDARRSSIVEMAALEQRYRAEREIYGAWNRLLEERPGEFSLFSHVEKLAGRADIMNRIAFIKPTESELPDSDVRMSRVEIKLVGLTIKQLVDYLHLLESGANAIRISRLSVERKGEVSATLDVVLQVETPLPASAGTGTAS